MSGGINGKCHFLFVPGGSNPPIAKKNRPCSGFAATASIGWGKNQLECRLMKVGAFKIHPLPGRWEKPEDLTRGVKIPLVDDLKKEMVLK